MADNLSMQRQTDPYLVVDQMLMADSVLGAFARGTLPMHAAGYRAVARWALESFDSMRSDSLRGLRDAAPPELQAIIENVLHDRGVIAWPADELAGMQAWRSTAALMRRCRRMPID